MTDRTHLDLFSGIGGFTLAANWNGIRTIGFCEIDERCRDFLAKAWPGVPIHDDIRSLNGSDYNGVWLLTAGVPCQPASRAGKQRGAEDDRWLWPEALRILAESRPTWCVFENPPGIRDVGLEGILSEVEDIGYDFPRDIEGKPIVFSIPACAVDAPHRRERYWIVGHTEKNEGSILHESERSGQSDIDIGGTISNIANSERRKWRPDQQEQREIGRNADWRTGAGELADSDQARRQRTNAESGSNGLCAEYCERHWSNFVWLPCADGKLRRAPDDTQRMVDGLPVELLEALAQEEGLTQEMIWNNSDSFQDVRITGAMPHRSLLGALGNSIVPQVAAEIIKAIIMSEDSAS